MERDKSNDQFTSEIFDRLLTFGTESDRPLFCQRLQSIWEEQSIFCQAHPTITNQTLDLYRLHRLVQDKQGYLEITTNRGWKEISNVLGFGDSGSAAYSVKRNYVRLGLLAYECRFDRTGMDPQSVIELSEMPHTVKKRKRGEGNVAVLRTLVKTNKQRVRAPSVQYDVDEPVDVCHAIPPMPTTQFVQPQTPSHDIQHFVHTLRAGWLADCNDHLEKLLFWLSDSRTAAQFHLKSYPGLLNAITEQYVACLYELFGRVFLHPSADNDAYMNWFVQLPFRIHDDALGPQSNQQRLEMLFFGTRRYVLRRYLADDPHDSPSPDRCHSIMSRSALLSTIIRNLSFLEDNEHLANDRRLVDILERVLSCHHRNMHESFDIDGQSTERHLHLCPNCSESLNDEETKDEGHASHLLSQLPIDVDNSSISITTNAYDQRHLMHLLDDTFITLANFSSVIDLRRCHPITRSRLIHTIIHWISCSLSFADQPFISMLSEDRSPTNKLPPVLISPRQLALQIFGKLCTREANVDSILADISCRQLQSFSHALLSLMNSSHLEDVNREYCLIIIYALCKRNRPSAEFFCAHPTCIALIFNYLEYYEYNQQQYLIATLTSYCNASSQMPVNHSIDMMVDSCIELLALFASVAENNCLKLFEGKLLDMSASIYFEQRALRAFADILYAIKS